MSTLSKLEVSQFVTIACPYGKADGSHELVHRFTLAEAERIIYALTQAYVDECSADTADPTEEPCMLDVRLWGRDPEVYAEHVQTRVSKRRHGIALSKEKKA